MMNMVLTYVTMVLFTGEVITGKEPQHEYQTDTSAADRNGMQGHL